MTVEELEINYLKNAQEKLRERVFALDAENQRLRQQVTELSEQVWKLGGMRPTTEKGNNG